MSSGYDYSTWRPHLEAAALLGREDRLVEEVNRWPIISNFSHDAREDCQPLFLLFFVLCHCEAHRRLQLPVLYASAAVDASELRIAKFLAFELMFEELLALKK